MIAKIILRNVNQLFDYAIPPSLGTPKSLLGKRVWVPFGNRHTLELGVVIALADSSSFSRLKSIAKIEDSTTPLLTNDLVDLTLWLKNFCFCTYFQALQCVMPAGTLSTGNSKLKLNDKIAKHVRLKCDKPTAEALSKNTKSVLQSKLIDLLLQVNCVALADICSNNQSMRSAVKALQNKEIVEVFDKKVSRNSIDYNNFKPTKPLKPFPQQQKVLTRLTQAIDSSTYTNFLLHGVTGSGKTEVFLQAIDHLISKGKQAIVLVPEISLTPQMIERFIGRFGQKVSVLHSRLSEGERLDEWHKIMSGDINVVVGARSAIFAPLPNLGMIVLDEEHESAYKSEKNPKYDTIDVAIYRAKSTGSIVISASATPLIAHYYKATELGEYELLTLNQRSNNSHLPKVTVVDTRAELASGNKTTFSRTLKREVESNLARGEQTILFLNRRGYNSYLMCANCGDAIKCPHCSVTLTYHKRWNKLVCHYCNYSISGVTECPSCGSNYIRYYGDGTQKVEGDIATLFPNSSCIRMDMDTTMAKNSHAQILGEFKDNSKDILIGTQMVTKGLDFENVTLVGVISADLSLNLPDYRSYERTFSLLTQVCGRAGRGDKIGRAVIQTFQPDHYVIKLARNHDYLGFYNQEIIMRKRFNNPPFCDIIQILAVGKDEKILEETLRQAVGMLNIRMQVSVPKPAPISVIEDNFRWRVLVKCAATDKVRAMLATITDSFATKPDVKLSIDINANNML